LISRVVRALACLTLTGLLLAAAAGAHGATPWFGTYQVSVSGGDQQATWSLSHIPVSGCDAPATGQGTDTQTFLPGGAQVVQLSGVGSTAFPTTISGLQLNYSEDREGSIKYGQPANANPAECAGASGEAAAPPTPDCGSRGLSTSIDVSPLPGSPALSESPSASTANAPHYKDCPVFGSVVPSFATPLTATLLLLGPAADGGVPSAVATLQASAPIAETDVSGQSTLKLELRVTRLLVIDALGMPADATLGVGASGAVNVPV
jgi:hypothetical protein